MDAALDAIVRNFGRGVTRKLQVSGTAMVDEAAETFVDDEPNTS
jgi:hypothetical protein